jgi:large subunit ribosomal protein L24
MKLKIKKGSTVQVIAGQDKGKKGTVIEIDPRKMKIKVQGVKVMTHFDKKEGVQQKEGFFDYSNVKLLEGPSASPKKTGKKTAAKRA